MNFASSEPVPGLAKNVPVKEIMATDLVAWHEDARITYPCDAVMRDDIRKPQRIRSQSGRVSIAAESTKTGHADHFWGLALVIKAIHAGGTGYADDSGADDDDAHYYRGRH